MRYGTVVGYVFSADIYCPAHIAHALAAHGFHVAPGELGDANAAEAMLNELAQLRGINRDDERTYDSGEFPKVVLAEHLDGDDYCGHVPGHKLEEN